MARLIKYGHANLKLSPLDSRLCKILNLCDGTADMTVKLLRGDLPDAKHYFAVPQDANSKDILILIQSDTIIEAYLTDKTGKLRAAAILKTTGAHLITNEKAAEKFKAEMTQYAKEAADLPPTGTAIPGNS